MVRWAEPLRAEKRWIVERLRHGTLERWRAEAAAYCGHTPAVLAAGVDPGVGPLGNWLGGLQPWGERVVLLALAETVTVGPDARRAALREAVRVWFRRGEKRLKLPLQFETRRFHDPEDPAVLIVRHASRHADRLAPWYLGADDSEVAQTYRAFFPKLYEDPETGACWTYRYSFARELQWVHRFEHARHPVSGRETYREVAATDGWSPGPGARRVPRAGDFGVARLLGKRALDEVPEEGRRRLVEELLRPA